MRFGCCGGVEQAQEIKSAGFDFLEVNAWVVLRGDEPDSAWAAGAPDPAKLPLPMEAANCLVPSRPIVGPKRDLPGLQAYLQRVAQRAQRLGIRRLVFGSGGARRRPEGVDVRTANEHLREFTRMAGEVCAGHDVVLVIEHLNRGECNTINFLAEARSLCDEVAHPGVGVLVDTYHFGVENDDDGAVLELGTQLRHVHVAEVVGRVEPGAKLPRADGQAFDFVDFFCLLRKIGYDERISVEATWSGPIASAGPPCANFLRAAWERAGQSEA